MELTVARDFSVFPSTLLSDPTAISSGKDTSWWLLHTKPRQEKAIAKDLVAREVAFYLPLTPRRTKIRGRVRTTRVPVFSSYVFMYGSPEDRVAALRTQRLVTTLPVNDPEPFLKDLRQIDQLIEAGKELTPESILEPGQRVRVKSGPLIDLEGTLIKRHSGNRLVVWIEQLLRGASVELEDCVVQAI